jgi:hypothetical protein
MIDFSGCPEELQLQLQQSFLNVKTKIKNCKGITKKTRSKLLEYANAPNIICEQHPTWGQKLKGVCEDPQKGAETFGEWIVICSKNIEKNPQIKNLAEKTIFHEIVHAAGGGEGEAYACVNICYEGESGALTPEFIESKKEFIEEEYGQYYAERCKWETDPKSRQSCEEEAIEKAKKEAERYEEMVSQGLCKLEKEEKTEWINWGVWLRIIKSILIMPLKWTPIKWPLPTCPKGLSCPPMVHTGIGEISQPVSTAEISGLKAETPTVEEAISGGIVKEAGLKLAGRVIDRGLISIYSQVQIGAEEMLYP